MPDGFCWAPAGEVIVSANNSGGEGLSLLTTEADLTVLWDVVYTEYSV